MGDENGGPSNIPVELVTEILFYLPIKSLIRFSCVCKSWLSIIRNDHQFAIKHYLTRTTSSSKVLDDVDYMFDCVEKSDKPCLYSFTGAKTFRFLKKFECVPDMPIGVSNSCHGIICFYLRLGSKIILCNPLIKEVVLLPPCPKKGRAALGFDPINNDYKVLAIACENFCTVSVYSMRHGYWRNLHVSASLLCIEKLEGYAASNANGRMCNWLFCKKLDSRTTVVALLSFDMVEEVLKELPMPKCLLPELLPQRHEHLLLSSSRWQACLSCLPDRWDFSGGFIDVWVLKRSSKNDCSEDWMWSKEFVVKCPGHEPMRPLGFWLNDKELLIIVGDNWIQEVFHYDLGTQQLRRTGRKGSLGCWARGYVESLVSIKHFMSPQHESKHGDDDKPNDDQEEASKQEDNGEFIFREVSRKGVRWFRSFK